MTPVFIASGTIRLADRFPTPVADRDDDDVDVACCPNRRTNERGLVVRYFENAASRARVCFCSAVDIEDEEVDERGEKVPRGFRAPPVRT